MCALYSYWTSRLAAVAWIHVEIEAEQADRTMSSAPTVITEYLRAAETGDLDTLVACFTEHGTVLDEGRTYHGREAIRGWRESLRSQWEYTTAVTGRESQGDAGYIIRTHVEGNFPGGVADLTYRFDLAGERITALTILP